ncbi:MAG: hypothetical protein MnENMB40S_24900 [Rhizobiaceae bacterium MnEN-MB40S]|nr:MAG: hypothetical protein MnENMB40S_24900 [Rhizobiaceae bacterium MnEN-MB40S]
MLTPVQRGSKSSAQKDYELQYATTVLWLICLFTVVGCQSQDPANIDLAVPASSTVEEIYIATTRARSEDAIEIFSGERGRGVDHAIVDVSIPPVHKTGSLERPRFGAPSPSLHITLADSSYVDSDEQFVNSVNAELDSRPLKERDILLFVHGYNNGFSDSVLRYAQFAHDSQFNGVRVLFTWASRGSALAYFYDRESATIARDGLEDTLKVLAKTKVRKIHILAHSMGNWVAMESLRQLQIEGDATLNGKIGEIVLASPDIDVDVFKSQMSRLGRPAKPYNLLISTDDRALIVSQRLSGNLPRLGNYTEDNEISDLGIIVYNITDVQSDDALRHGKFASAPEIVQLLGSRLSEGNKLAENNVRFSDRLQKLGDNIVGVVAATGEIVVYTPQTVLVHPDQIITAPVEVLEDTIKQIELNTDKRQSY